MTKDQIADWLEKRGMSEYTQRFIENRIDLSVLPDLTEEDLQKLGSCLAIAARCCVGLPTSKLVKTSHLPRALQLQHLKCEVWLNQPSDGKLP